MCLRQMIQNQQPDFHSVSRKKKKKVDPRSDVQLCVKQIRLGMTLTPQTKLIYGGVMLFIAFLKLYYFTLFF